MLIQQATLEDVQGVLDLLKANHVSHVSDKTDGFVTTNMTEKQLVTLITKENGYGRIMGVLGGMAVLCLYDRTTTKFFF